MNLYNQKQIAGGTEFLVGELKYYNENTSATLEHKDYYKKIIELALVINKNKTINKKDIKYIKISAITGYFHYLTYLNVEIITEDKRGATIKNRLEIDIERASNKSRHYKEERDEFLGWSGILAIASTGLHFLAKASATAGSIWGEFASVVMGLGAIHIFIKAIGYALKHQKFKNPLLAIVALDKGIYTAEVTEKALEKIKSNKKNNAPTRIGGIRA